jgi:hypothetical protein
MRESPLFRSQSAARSRPISGQFFGAAAPPLAPNSTAALRSGSVSSSSPVAIRISFTALPITSAGRFSPRDH